MGFDRHAKVAQAYAWNDRAPRAQGAAVQLLAGMVAAVSPRIGDVRQAGNAFGDRVPISIHVSGANISEVLRSVY